MNEALASLGTPELLALAAALGWSSGLRLYAVVFLVGMAGATGWLRLWATMCCTSIAVCTTSTRKKTRNAILPSKPGKSSKSRAGTWLMP